jgi:Phosphodiester glycosidase
MGSMSRTGRARVVRTLVVVLLAAAALSFRQAMWLSPAEVVAPGVVYLTSTDPSLVDPPAPTSVFLLRLDPAGVRLTSALGHDEVLGAEPVEAIAARHHAVAAVNGGFFNTQNGESIGVLKIASELVSDDAAVKGAVIIRSPPQGRTELDFDQVAARASLTFHAGGHDWTIPIDGVDTTRGRGKLMLFTPSYHADTDTAANGVEWVLEGRPLRVAAVRRDVGHTPIPPQGAVLSYGGLTLPPALAALTSGVTVSIRTAWTSVNGLPAARFDRADAIVNGAGLLRVHGRAPDNWQQAEGLNPASFIDMRHPRTFIGKDGQGFIWLGVVDGRQPDHGVGMTFADLERLCDRLGLTDALNLDGGGSTTMVVLGRIVNHPSDAAGPRPVSDAILVTVRGSQPGR